MDDIRKPEIKKDPELRWFQGDALNAILAYFRKTEGRSNPLVVAPTGSGKSFIIAGFCQLVREQWPDQKILILSHVKEILSQNKKTIEALMPNEKIGVWSAGLNSKNIKPITIASVQSAYNHPDKFTDFNIVLVDECHLIPHKGQGRYRTLLQSWNKPIVGFTATPFRLGAGYLHLGEGAFFDEIVYNITIKQLIEEGYLCKVTQKATNERLNPEGIRKQGGDFVIKELALKFNREAITRKIIKELLQYRKSRKKWLLFAVDIAHAENIARLLNEEGIWTEAVHSKMKAGARDRAVERFKKDPRLQCLVSVAVLTTGFDAPSVDLVGLLRPTSSPVLHVQIIGRGLRPFPGKENCLVLDFAGNLMRNGPIDAPVIKVAKGDGTGEPIMKECPECFEIVHAAVRVCPSCGEPFQFQHHLHATSGNRAVLSEPEWHNVLSVDYDAYHARSGFWMLRVKYNCGLRMFSEYIGLEHTGYAHYRAKHWWRRRYPTPEIPETVADALARVNDLREPTRILVDESGRYPKIKEQEM